MTARFVFVPLVLALTACGAQSDAGAIDPGKSCNATDAGCRSGTTCLVESATLGSGCSSMEKLCTVACTDDPPCVTLLGAGAHCTASCNGSPTVCVPAN